jgi:CRP-like cAMP-binding protein
MPLDRSLIRSFALFEAIPSEALDEILARAQPRRIAKGSVVFHQGQTADEFYVLVNGKLRVTQISPAGEQLVVRFVTPGEIFGVAMALDRLDYPGSAEAVVECLVLAWPSSYWPDLVAKVPQFALNTLQTVGRRLQEAHTRLREMATQEVERRVAHTLLRLMSQAGRPAGDKVVIDLPVTRQDIAQMTGTTLHSVSRILSSWEKLGLVESGRRKITVIDESGLSRLAE